MLRLSLEELILQILALDLGDPYTFLESAISPPDSLSIRNALRFLDNLSAVVVEGDEEGSNELNSKSVASIGKNIQNSSRVDNTGKVGGMGGGTVQSGGVRGGKDASHSSGNSNSPPITSPMERLKSQITPLGFHLAALPVNPRIGKLMLFGALMGCIDPILTIAATVSAKSPFIMSFDEREKADEAKLRFCDSDSDLLTMLNAYQSWKRICESVKSETTSKSNYGGGSNGYYGKDSSRYRQSSLLEDNYCNENYLSYNALQMIDQMRAQFLDLLKDISFLPYDVNVDNISSCYENRNGNDIGMITSVLCASLVPNILQIPLLARYEYS